MSAIDDQDKVVVVGVGAYKIARSPAVIRTTLGSCVAICLYEPMQKIGGLLHISLPDSAIQNGRPIMNRSKYADTGMQDYLKAFEDKYRIRASKLKAKIFGGAKILTMISHEIGAENKLAISKLLDMYKIPILVDRTGGEKGYFIQMDCETGLVKCRVFGEKTIDY
ncbi:MAG: chemotaxis protein CheD [Candidatus Omnitrophota bacterium]|jgi:chemotaxis protein CheD